MIFRDSLVDKKGGGGKAFIHRFAQPVFRSQLGILVEGCHPMAKFPRMHRAACLPDGPFHLEVDEALEFDGVFHRELADEVVDEAVDGE